MFKFLSFSLTALATQYAGAADTAIERSLPVPSHVEVVRSFEKPMDSSQSLETLTIRVPLYFSQLTPLKEERYKVISIQGSYLVNQQGDIDALTVSPKIFNPLVQSLTLTACNLDDTYLTKIGNFKHLKRLDLSSNRITDETTPYIASVTSLEYLSLAATHISDSSIPQLLAMPNLRELDISRNEDITDEVVNLLLADTKLRNVRVAFSGMSRPNQRKIKQKYNPSPQFIP
ncbi:hypothetical protein [Candidatus Paracaedibacter symbiosus]|uniref:hypothetical protein n=1 Tax=Candidatus Paracaedibacter symbiosus TaxID=244582 RepID=UPI0005099A4A|nr:hypothetical protein [Candidatus Paracaedibacter symbiosus]